MRQLAVFLRGEFNIVSLVLSPALVPFKASSHSRSLVLVFAGFTFQKTAFTMTAYLQGFFSESEVPSTDWNTNYPAQPLAFKESLQGTQGLR